MEENYIESPCIKKCGYISSELLICKGCGRTNEEITSWLKYENLEKFNAIEKSKQRLLDYDFDIFGRSDR